MEDSDVDDPAGEKQHYRPVVPASGRSADAGRGIPPTPKTHPQERTQKSDDASRIRGLRADETGAKNRDALDGSRTPRRGEQGSTEIGEVETDGEPSGNP